MTWEGSGLQEARPLLVHSRLRRRPVAARTMTLRRKPLILVVEFALMPSLAVTLGLLLAGTVQRPR